MKRKLLALAVGVALAPCANAQVTSQAGSEWEFYGKFYPEMTHSHGDGATGPTATVSTLTGAHTGVNAVIPRWEQQISNTYIGFRGSKKMGGGLTGIWQLEQVAPIDEGGGTLGGRNSFVGIAGDAWGTFRMGNLDTPYKNNSNILGFLGVNSGNFVSAPNVLEKGPFGTSSSSSFNLRRANSLDFSSPQILDGLQTQVQFSKGNPTDSSTTAGAAQTITPVQRDPRVVSWSVKWERGPLFAAFSQESHLDLFGGSNNVPAAVANAVTTDPSLHSVDTSNLVAVVYRLGVHSIEADFATKKYHEVNVTPTVAGKFQQYTNNAYMINIENRWSSAWRTAFHYVKGTAGKCQVLSTVNAACNTTGLEGTQISAGLAHYLDPQLNIFFLVSKLMNGASAQYNSTASFKPNPGEDVTTGAVGIAYSF